MIKNNFYKQQKTGFTLIEIMVATSIFMVVMLIAVGSLVVSSDSAKKAKKLRNTVDNVNFVMDSMTQAIRMGTNYTCVVRANSSTSVSMDSTLGPNDCLLGDAGNFIAFIPAKESSSVRVGYQSSKRADGTSSLQRCDSTSNPICVDIISPDVDLQVLKFFVKGSSPADEIQPSVYIVMKGVIKIGNESTPFALQTMASERSLQ